MRRSGERSSFNDVWIVLAVLLVSFLLRVILIVRGGQYYISDETRYEVPREAAGLLLHGQVGEAFRQFTISPEHLGFKVIGIIPAMAERVVGTSLVMPALFFSLFSILNLYLIFLLSRQSRASSSEPVYALCFAASCMSLLYYSRHLFPYDMAISFGLLALYMARAPTQSIKASFACGALSFLCFITYNGYWPLAGFAMITNGLAKQITITELVKRTTWTAVGFAGSLAAVILAMLGSGTDMIAAYRLFATSITQGAFEEGWSLPFEYFWHAEHLLFPILSGLSLYAIASNPKRSHTIVWAAGIFFVYLCLLIPSVFLHSFVVYGRLARQLLPFFILLAAQGLASLENRGFVATPVAVALWMVVLIQAAWNFGLSYQLYYPRQFSESLQAEFPTFAFSSKRLAYGAPTVCQSNGYAVENVKYFLSAPEAKQSVRGEVLFDVPHPVNFLPYQYEGYTPDQRRDFRKHKLHMRFYQVDEAFASESSPAWMSIKNCAIRGD